MLQASGRGSPEGGGAGPGQAARPQLRLLQQVTHDPAQEVAAALTLLVLQRVASELQPKVRNHGEGPY